MYSSASLSGQNEEQNLRLHQHQNESIQKSSTISFLLLFMFNFLFIPSSLSPPNVFLWKHEVVMMSRQTSVHLADVSPCIDDQSEVIHQTVTCLSSSHANILKAISYLLMLKHVCVCVSAGRIRLPSAPSRVWNKQTNRTLFF